MAIDTKPKSEAAKPLQLRDNPEVKKKIEAHKAANPNDAAFYTRLVKEYPERAVETLILRDAQRHENEMRLVQKQLPQAQAFYEAQSAEVKKRIDQALKEVPEYYREKALVQEVLREKDREARRELLTPKAGIKASV